jgi:Protein of unknown function (DUF2795)
MKNPMQLQKVLGDVDFPIDKNTLVQQAKEHGVDDELIRRLRDVPQDRFNSPSDVSEAVMNR